MNKCKYCGNEMDEERPYDYCMEYECYEKGFAKASFVVLGVHKSNPIVCSVDDSLVTAQVSYMNHK